VCRLMIQTARRLAGGTRAFPRINHSPNQSFTEGAAAAAAAAAHLSSIPSSCCFPVCKILFSAQHRPFLIPINLHCQFLLAVLVGFLVLISAKGPYELRAAAGVAVFVSFYTQVMPVHHQRRCTQALRTTLQYREIAQYASLRTDEPHALYTSDTHHHLSSSRWLLPMPGSASCLLRPSQHQHVGQKP
jgi:hypothetical protein